MNEPGRRSLQRLVTLFLLSSTLTLALIIAILRPAGGDLLAIIGVGLASALLMLAAAGRFVARLLATESGLIGEAAVATGRAHKAEEERRVLEQVLAVVRQGVILVGEDDTIAYANPAALQLVRPSDRLATLTPHGLQRLVRQARLQQAISEEDMEHGSPVRTLRAAGVAFPDDKRVLITITDVTESNRIESVRRDFVAAASHELKTPVAAILASTEALNLALTRDPASAERFGAQLERTARQLARLISDLLDLSRVESSALEMEEVAVDRLVEQEVARIRPMAEEAGLTVALEIVPIRVAASEPDLGLAVRNLLDNAIRHTAPRGSMTITVARSGDRCVITVKDTGEGIPQRELPRIFERFYRVDAARARATGGTGLGLAIVKHVVERHAGSVSVESELGVGSTFRVDLPSADQSAAEGGIRD